MQALAAAQKLDVLLTLTAYTQLFLEENGFGSWLITQETELNMLSMLVMLKIATFWHGHGDDEHKFHQMHLPSGDQPRLTHTVMKTLVVVMIIMVFT